MHKSLKHDVGSSIPRLSIWQYLLGEVNQLNGSQYFEGLVSTVTREDIQIEKNGAHHIWWWEENKKCVNKFQSSLIKKKLGYALFSFWTWVGRGEKSFEYTKPLAYAHCQNPKIGSAWTFNLFSLLHLYYAIFKPKLKTRIGGVLFEVWLLEWSLQF